MRATALPFIWPWLSKRDKLAFAPTSPGWLIWFREQELAEFLEHGQPLAAAASTHALPITSTDLSEAEVIYLQERQKESDALDKLHEEETKRKQRKWLKREYGVDAEAVSPCWSDSD